MKPVISFVLLGIASLAVAQGGHDSKAADALKKLSVLEGDWKGKQNFNNPGGPAMVGDITLHAHAVIGGRYFEELLSTSLPGRKPTDSRHYIGFDSAAGKFKAWWFNDTSNIPMQLEGTLDGNKLVLMTSPGPDGTIAGPTFRATYDFASDHALNYVLELKTGEDWRALFHSNYTK
ncbi:MAG: DUF1579 family protein [Fimbriimonas sp.]|nr:DUF1579 family protein [Fimbriimonas sp.]